MSPSHAASVASVSAPRRMPRRRMGEDLLERIGSTPLLRVTPAQSPGTRVEIYAKAEWFNPGGSVKDRAALSMIREGVRRHQLVPGKTLVDATSGNTGIAYAMIGAAQGFPVKLWLPAGASPERQRILGAYGAELVLTPAEEGADGAIRRVREAVAAHPDLYFYPDQYSNSANWRAHYETTSVEIWRQAGGRITHFVAGLGTSGTFMGVTRRLKEIDPRIRAISFQPDAAFHGLEGLKHMATAIVPAIYDSSLADENLAVRTEDAYAQVKRLAREQGLLVGVSSGAALCACLAVAQSLPQGGPAVIVTVFPDSAEKYLGERFWGEE